MSITNRYERKVPFSVLHASVTKTNCTCSAFHCKNTHTVQTMKLLFYLIRIAVNIQVFLRSFPLLSMKIKNNKKIKISRNKIAHFSLKHKKTYSQIVCNHRVTFKQPSATGCSHLVATGPLVDLILINTVRLQYEIIVVKNKFSLS